MRALLPRSASLRAALLAPAGLAFAVCCTGDADGAGKKNAAPAKPAAGSPSARPAAAPAALAGKLELRPVIKKLRMPVDLDSAPGDGSGRLFVVEKLGWVRVLKPPATPGGELVLEPTPALDLSDRVSKGSEQGILGLAFHPDFAKNRKLYLNYTDKKNHTHVAEFTVSATNPDVIDPASEREVLFVEQPYSNHNGGHVAFGPDGKLWVGLGDGGAANDPLGAGQDDGTRLAKMLLVDVDAAKPTVTQHMKGLRNPWRYAFDAKTGDLYIADVGQNEWEEIHVVDAADAKKGGQNFGWNVLEGTNCFKPKKGCKSAGLVKPQVEYRHSDGTGCSITGGEVYRGKAVPELDGAYFYADYCTAVLRSFRWQGGKVVDHFEWKPALDPKNRLSQISAFGVDAEGELYVLSLGGTIWKLARKP